MKAVGIICEYNPFHNGHLYHIKETKKLFPNHIIILIVSGPFTERADASILTKWEKADIALTYGIDLVIELPFIFATGSADLFARGAITILKELKIEALVFGSENNNISKLKKLASIQFEDSFQKKVNEIMKAGINYPTALSKVLLEITGESVSTPNDLLAISYIKEIIKQNAFITPICIQRTNQYHSLEKEKIASATSIRQSIKEKNDITHMVPSISFSRIHREVNIENFFSLLKYKIISEKESLLKYHEVSEKILPRLIKNIMCANDLEEFIHLVKSKSETYSKIKRICLYILCGLTKEEATYYKNHPYIRILGFSQIGKQYLNHIKKEIHIPFISNYSNDKNHLLKLDFKVHQIYIMGFDKQKQEKLLLEEVQNHPIYKKNN